MDLQKWQAEVLALLSESPIVRESVHKDVKDFIRVGEVGLAFDTMCSWLYEDELKIPSAFYDRLKALAVEMDEQEAIARLEELVTDPHNADG